ncbi:MAG TPA: sulfurtransferase [Solirubrobacteraceae bacterium]|nr:sulfurtransferase [Solirubrobacteraceae bacterium]
MDPIVSTEWLSGAGPDVVLVDVRWYPDGRSPAAEFSAGHLPGAVLAPLDDVCSDPASDAGGRHPLPTPTGFADRLSALGIGDGDIVVAYDDAGGVLAARLVWMLRALGHDAAVLDAGLGPFPETGAGPPLPARRPPLTVPDEWPPQLLASIDDVATRRDGEVLIDARPRDRFEGAPDPLDPRAGHIPGSRSLPCREHLGADGRLLDVEQLRERLAGVGIEAGGPGFISSCGSGVTACHNLLVAEHVGVGRGRLFPGSWSQWSRDPARPGAPGPAG